MLKIKINRIKLAYYYLGIPKYHTISEVIKISIVVHRKR